MSKRLAIPLFAISTVLIGNSAPILAFQTSGDSAKPKADNTRANKQDRERGEPSADQARQNKGDRELMQQIRKSIMEDKALSTYAHNVKIIARNGKVTLKGAVRSEEEKRTIESKAVAVAGQGNVTGELTVKPAKRASAKQGHGRRG